jgi:hypothetical protein
MSHLDAVTQNKSGTATKIAAFVAFLLVPLFALTYAAWTSWLLYSADAMTPSNTLSATIKVGQTETVRRTSKTTGSSNSTYGIRAVEPAALSGKLFEISGIADGASMITTLGNQTVEIRYVHNSFLWLSDRQLLEVKRGERTIVSFEQGRRAFKDGYAWWSIGIAWLFGLAAAWGFVSEAISFRRDTKAKT